MAISLLEILCEEIRLEKSETNVQSVYKHIALHKTMVYFYEQYNFDYKSDDAIDAAIKTHNLIKHMENFSDIKTGIVACMNL